MKNAFLRLSLLGLLTLGFFSCEQDERDYALDVIVTVNDSIRAQNALVHIYAPVENTNIDIFRYTDERGMVSIQQPNKAVLEIVASRPGFKACSFAELDRGLTTVQVDLKPFDNQDNGCRNNQ